MNHAPTLIHASGIAGNAPTSSPPNAILLDAPRSPDGPWPILALGSVDEVQLHPSAAHANRLDLPGRVLLPALVNAHTHLDLTHLGPQPLDESRGFAEWGKWITQSRLDEPDQLRASVAQGLRMSLKGGVAAVGDIAGAWRIEPVEVLRGSGLWGVSHLEVFGVGAEREIAAAERLEAILESRRDLRAPGRARMGISPHATYSIGPDLYRHSSQLAGRYGVQLATHVAECPEERQVLQTGDGPIRSLLSELGLWSDEVARRLRTEASPVRHVLESVGERGPIVAVHVCDCSDEDIELLARAGASVVYCPRANEYFRYAESFGPHRYRDMLDAGISVSLGTDSIVCLPRDEADRISTLDEMRRLSRRDGADPNILLEMATTNGAHALGLDPSLFQIAEGNAIAGLCAVPINETDRDDDPIAAALASDSPVELALGPELQV